MRLEATMMVGNQHGIAEGLTVKTRQKNNQSFEQLRPEASSDHETTDKSTEQSSY